jgi:hypothetical protein
MSELRLNTDGHIIKLGADNDVTLTHVADTGILLNSTMQLQFNDASQFINAPSATVLDINATDEIELNATAVDLNGTLDVSGATTTAALTASGILKTDDATEATSTTDGSLQTDGGLSVVKDTVMGDDLKLLSDASVIHFGANSEITLTHSHDSGLLLKHTATADDKPINLVLQTGETDMAANDVIGKISWQAPDEGTGTDAILVSAAIQAVAEGDHSSSSNATRLEFMTGSSEAATSQMSISSGGIVGIGAGVPGDLGAGLHIKTADSGASANGESDELVIEGTAEVGINILSATDGSGSIFFGDSGANGQGRIVYYHGDDSMRFVRNSSEVFRIDTNGYILQGKTTSNTANEGTESHGSQISVTRDNQYASYVARKNGADGDVLQFLRDASVVGEITVNSSSTAYNTSSDYRLKENVDYDFDATTRLKQLKPARFNFIIDETNTLVDGFLAHEVSSIIPEAITGTKDKTEVANKVVSDVNGKFLERDIEEANWTQGKTDGVYASNTTWSATKTIPVYQSIDQSKLVPLMVKTIQELEARIKTLEDA